MTTSRLSYQNTRWTSKMQARRDIKFLMLCSWMSILLFSFYFIFLTNGLLWGWCLWWSHRFMRFCSRESLTRFSFMYKKKIHDRKQRDVKQQDSGRERLCITFEYQKSWRHKRDKSHWNFREFILGRKWNAHEITTKRSKGEQHFLEIFPSI
jgi:hypothetical protein